MRDMHRRNQAGYINRACIGRNVNHIRRCGPVDGDHVCLRITSPAAQRAGEINVHLCYRRAGEAVNGQIVCASEGLPIFSTLNVLSTGSPDSVCPTHSFGGCSSP